MTISRIGKALTRKLNIYFSTRAVDSLYILDIKRKCKEAKCKELTRSQKIEIKDYFDSFGLKSINTDWHKFYTHVTGNFFKEYIPANLFYNVIIPHLNMKEMCPGLMDKNILSLLFPNIRQPEIVAKNINGLYFSEYNREILNLEDVLIKCYGQSKLIIKPSIDSGGGKNVVVFTLDGEFTDFKNLSLRELILSFGKNFVIQKYLDQHKTLHDLNPSSVNTIRIKSLIINGKVEMLKSVVRIGGLNSKVDNIRQGGIYCDILEDGTLSGTGYNRDNKGVSISPTGIVLKGYSIPNLGKIFDEIKVMHKQVPHFRMISWDIVLGPNFEIILLEYNTMGQGYSEESGPIFREFTDQILSECGQSR